MSTTTPARQRHATASTSASGTSNTTSPLRSTFAVTRPFDFGGSGVNRPQLSRESSFTPDTQRRMKRHDESYHDDRNKISRHRRATSSIAQLSTFLHRLAGDQTPHVEGLTLPPVSTWSERKQYEEIYRFPAPQANILSSRAPTRRRTCVAATRFIIGAIALGLLILGAAGEPRRAHIRHHLGELMMSNPLYVGFTAINSPVPIPAPQDAAQVVLQSSSRGRKCAHSLARSRETLVLSAKGRQCIDIPSALPHLWRVQFCYVPDTPDGGHCNTGNFLISAVSQDLGGWEKTALFQQSGPGVLTDTNSKARTQRALNPSRCSVKPDASLVHASDQLVAQHYGPDAFEIVIDGAERVVLTRPHYLGQCRYEYSLTETGLSNAGALTIKDIRWQYTDHMAFLSTAKPTFALYNSSLLDGPYPLPKELCARSCTSERVSVSPRGNFKSPDLPLCKRGSDIEGTYLPTTGGGPTYAWRPRTCRLDPATDQLNLKRSRCLRPGALSTTQPGRRRIAFIGDSHARYIYDGLVARLNGSEPVYVKGSVKKFIAERLQIDFFFEPELASFLLRKRPDDDKYHHIVLSVGAHQSGNPNADIRLETSQWINFINSTLRDRIERSPSHQSFILLTPPAARRVIPKGIMQEFWRTDPRMQHWSALASDLLRNTRITTIDGFKLSAPFVRDTHDAVHYAGTPVLRAMEDQILHHLGICAEQQAEDRFRRLVKHERRRHMY
ncbi:uncharacterized protein L969DRAFT_95004 [Mixia osmundae IAM 14324]|uniref:Uncharacterized protein n=1 Tax=Mixia osmundae (strain CBS 9802 / IAM 14324 / JCM 22182 / KY 12970) TaxID=764103 RepID=G7E121_MIXOS|nr:uncharacterized protein L969DRAFT_95004 [Mixia osmundae IAM 14324]KEI38833.1 hypothetical protein L969DRAFT_95004 [Mixia osmundae IAM 14324]GAA96531.1 hypothetical protein E5Q_03199 [Mixia osmundae IAM 14324]